MNKTDFDTPQWQEYFKGKFPEEIEKIKKLFEERGKENGKEYKKGNTLFIKFLKWTAKSILFLLAVGFLIVGIWAVSVPPKKYFSGLVHFS